MDCREVQGFIHAYLDGEFAERERADVEAHIEQCAACRSVVAFGERLHARLRASARDEKTAPPWLRARVLAALDHTEPRESWARRWVWRLVPAAVAVVLVVGSFASREQVLGVEEARLMPLAEQSILWHRKQLPFDVPGPSAESVQHFFRDKVPFAVRVPHFSDPGVRFVGARLTNLREHPAAYLIYQVGNARISVFVLGNEVMPLLRERHQRRMRAINGYHVAMYASGSTVYAVTSEMDGQKLAQLVADLR